ncbi:MAG TPA: alpha/beta hydrolase [Acidimicrobiia bacterium]
MALRSFAGGALFAEVLGEGAPRILALHGWGRRGSDFRKALSGLPALAPDLPGFGASPAPTEVIGAKGYAEVVAPMLDALEAPITLVGHSFGGRVAMRLAADNPAKIASLVLIGVPLLRLHPARKPSLTYRLLRFANRIGMVPDEVMERRRRRSGSADYRAATGIMRDVLVKVVGETYESELASVDQPIHLLWGEQDREVPVEVARRAFAMREGAGLPVSLEIAEGVGHLLPLEAPDRLRAAVLERLG